MDNYNEFKEKLKEELAGIFSDKDYKAEIKDAISHKANKDCDGISVRLDSSNVSPLIYTESLWENFKETAISIREMAERMADTAIAAYDEYKNIGFAPEKFDKDYIMENSYLAVVNTGMNRDFLSGVPHEEIKGTDLSAYAKVHVGDNCSITIDNEHAFSMGMTGSEVIDTARENTLKQDFSVKSMQDTLSEMMPEAVDSKEFFEMPSNEYVSMCVITNEPQFDGANAIISKDALNEACELMGCDKAIILPSSRHELLAVNPELMGLGSTAGLKAMVEDVNRSQVALEDKLSDNIYEYDSKRCELALCNEEGLFTSRSEPEPGRSMRMGI